MKKFTLYIEDDKHLKLQGVVNRINSENDNYKTNLNKLINGFIDDALASSSLKNMETRFNESINEISSVLENQNKSLSALITWHEIHAQMLKDLLGDE